VRTKAASNAISHYLQLGARRISNRVIIAREELEHLQMVHDLKKSKGLTLGRERKDHYVNELLSS
jgi:tRNA-(ms[2]io[6]A)-hydroxylase